MNELNEEGKTVISAGQLLKELYESGKGEAYIDIMDDFYSNIANIQVSNTDVLIDFLVLPGINKDGKVCVRGKRVHIPHSTAQRLAEILINSLEKSYKNNQMETYLPISSHKEKDNP